MSNLIWEELSAEEKEAIKHMSENDFLTMLRIWYALIQGETWGVNWHHRYLARCIEEIIQGTRKDTIFNVTPGSSKTEMFSIHFPLYSTIKLKRVRNLNLSFADSLVKRNSKRVREVLKSKEWQECWPAKFGTCKDDELQMLNDDGKVKFEMISKAAGAQVTGSRGGYITEHYSGCLLLDDIDKPDDMLSKVRRESVHMLLKNTIRSRRASSKKGSSTPIISIQQRLHTQDSTWFMLSGGMGIEFDQLSIPALVTEEYGKSLPEWLQPYFEADVLSSDFVVIDGVKHYSFWPAKESVEDLVKLKEADPYTFMSQYQQAPIALGGNVFKVEWFRKYGSSPDADVPKPDRFDYTFVTADTAQKTGELNDYTVICYWGMYKGDIYFIDGIRGKWEAPDLATNFDAFIKQCWKRNKECGVMRHIWVEDKSSGTGLIQAFAKKFPIEITPVQRDKDKVVRAMDAAPAMKAGKVLFPEKHEMLSEAMAEVAAFTYDMTHKHDDFVDNLIDAVNLESNLPDDPVERMKRLAGIK